MSHDDDDDDYLDRAEWEREQRESEERARRAKEREPRLLDVRKFVDPEYAEKYTKDFAAYVEARINGLTPEQAAIDAFQLIRYNVALYQARELGLASDANPWVRERFQKALAAKDIKKELWPLHKAVHRLLSLIENPSVKDQVRLGAIDRLNIICSHTAMADGLQTAIGRKLADFYRDQTTAPPPPPPSGGDPAGDSPSHITH